MKVLITGGTGSLGKNLVREALAAGSEVRLLSRRPRPLKDVLYGVEWAQGEITSAKGIRAALDGMDAVIHAASDPFNAAKVDVGGTEHLINAAKDAGISHIVYISIVGVDEIPYRYYRFKRQAEELIESSGLSYTILRATQFYSLADRFLSAAAYIPFLMPLPTDFKFQCVDEAEVAARLVKCLKVGARGRVEDFGGPKITTLGEMTKIWIKKKGICKKLVRLPMPGEIADGFRAGLNTASNRMCGKVGWQDWLLKQSENAGS